MQKRSPGQAPAKLPPLSPPRDRTAERRNANGLTNPASVSTNEFLTMVLLNNGRQDAPPATVRAAVTTALRRFLSMQWWINAPLPLKVAYFGLACAVVFGLAAAIAGVEFGREAEDQVVEVTEDLLTIASLGGGPVLVMGLISSFARRRMSERTHVR